MANVLGTLFGDIANAIREKSGESGTMKPAEFPAKIAAIPTGGGGSAAGAVTVTFCNYDGTELYSRQVFIGDDCPDPVTQGKMPTPTRESTAQYDYTYNGWSATAGGSASASALKNITADKTVYAAYSGAVRYYTISFYDGGTLLKSEQYAYGTTPEYFPTKENFSFAGWEPSLAPVTGDASYSATWTTVITFANASWEEIALISERGEATEYFALGDKKQFKLTVGGRTETVEVEIAGFGMDDLSDGTGKAGITLISTHCHNLQYESFASLSYELRAPDYAWESSYLREYLSTKLYNGLPESLRGAIKQVSKKSLVTKTSYDYTDDTCWVPSWAELGCSTYYDTSTAPDDSPKYPIFSDDTSRLRNESLTNKYSRKYAVRNATGGQYGHLGCITDKGLGGRWYEASKFTLICFCI